MPTVHACVVSGGRRSWAGLVLWTAFASLTPTGGVIALLVIACVGVAARRGRGALAAVGVGLAFQLAWVLPSVLGAGSGLSDPRGVDLFAARAERPGGAVLSLVTGGGIWDPAAVPDTLGTPLGQVLVGLCLLALVGGARRVRDGFPGLLAAALVGFALAVAGTVPLLDDGIAWAVAHVPGGGLLRDGQKFVAPWVLLLLLSGAESLSRAQDWLRGRDRDLARVLAGVLALLPAALVVDAPGQTHEVLRPVSYPADLRAADPGPRRRTLRLGRRGHAALGVVPALHLGPAGVRVRPRHPLVSPGR